MSASTLNSRSVIFTMRMPLEHRERLMTAAGERNRSLANYLVEAGLVEAERKLEPEPAKLPRRHARVEMAA
jgi:ParB-like chromosome segregation protein Spo0J